MPRDFYKDNRLARVLATNIIRLMREQNISQTNLAEGTGLAPGTIGKLVNNPKGVQLNTLESVAKFFNVEPSSLLVESNVEQH